MTNTIFFVSMFFLALIAGLRAYQMKFRQFGFLNNLYLRGDFLINSVSDYLVFKYNRWRKISHIFVFEFLPSLLYENLVKAKDYVSKKYYENGDKFRGRRVLRSHGSVSFFLGRLSEDKAPSRERRV